jgi:hypothetical protein
MIAALKLNDYVLNCIATIDRLWSLPEFIEGSLTFTFGNSIRHYANVITPNNVSSSYKAQIPRASG